MTKDEIKKEWDAFIEYPEGSGKLYVTTTSALLFARHITDIAADKEREACAQECERPIRPGGLTPTWCRDKSAYECAAAIRARKDLT